MSNRLDMKIFLQQIVLQSSALIEKSSKMCVSSVVKFVITVWNPSNISNNKRPNIYLFISCLAVVREESTHYLHLIRGPDIE